MKKSQPIINVAIFAHVDAGKTTLTEKVLVESGTLKTPGRVDRGTAQTDDLEVERDRGISVRTSSAMVEWRGVRINVIDTPGHTDFSSEVERALLAPDMAVLLISAVEGIQAQTSLIWEALSKRKIPLLIFINKVDRMGADTGEVINQIRNEFKFNPLVLQKIEGEGTRGIRVSTVIGCDSIDPGVFEQLAEYDDQLLNMFLEEKRPDYSSIVHQIKTQISDRRQIPLLYGSALNGVGIVEFMDCLVDFFPVSENQSDASLSGVIFKIEHHSVLGRMAYVRVFSGTISNRSMVYNSSRDITEKVTQVKKKNIGKITDTGRVHAGDIAILLGLRASMAGDALGIPAFIPDDLNLNHSVIRVQVHSTESQDFNTLFEGVQRLADEDPALKFEWFKEERELSLNVMGKIHMEVLESQLLNRFGIQAKFGRPRIIYQETPEKTAIGFEEYTMPKPCWAVVKFRIEPGSLHSGIEYVSEVGIDKIARKYQQEIKRSIEPALKQGIKGWSVTDLKVTLIDGEHHMVHSRAGDFVVATHIALMKALTASGTKLLEPCIRFKIEIDREFLNKINGDMIQMRGNIRETALTPTTAVLKGIVPIATSMDYHIRLASISSGSARYATRFHGYLDCPVELGETRDYRGINPLDRSKYILWARKAVVK